jgi:hypothetical protein
MNRVVLFIIGLMIIIVLFLTTDYFQNNNSDSLAAKQQEKINTISSCYYSGVSSNASSTKKDKPVDDQYLFNKILESIECQDTFNFLESDVPVAAAFLTKKNNQTIREILFNSESINDALLNNNKTYRQQIIISILAHEIAHHMLGHTLKYDESRPLTEIEADRFSGYVSRMLGSSLDQAQLAVNIFSNEEATQTHPSRKARLIAVKNGYNDGKSMDWQSYTFIQRNTPRPDDNSKEAYNFNSVISDAPIFALAVRNRILSNSEKRYIYTKDSVYFDKIQAETLLATLLPGTPVNVLRKVGDYYEIEAIVGNRRIIGYINVFEYGKHSILESKK